MESLTELLAGPVLEVAPRLLGARFEHAGVVVRITEVEAYDGPADPGSHAHRGLTPRNEVMFGPPAHLYTYFTYGMHWCCNVVTGPEGSASAVLLRAAEVVDGLDLARERRRGCRDRDLARGPILREPQHVPGPWPSRSAQMINDLEVPIARHHPEIDQMKAALRRAGAAAAAMSGSGSAVFGLFQKRSDALAAGSRLDGSGWRVLLSESLGRGEFARLSKPRPLTNGLAILSI